MDEKQRRAGPHGWWRGRVLTFFAGMLIGGGAMAALVAAHPEPVRPVALTLHRFDLRPEQQAKAREWIAYLEAHHDEAVATLARERMYVEAMFLPADEPLRLYWLTVEGAGARSVESSTSELDRRHVAYMDAVLARGSHRRIAARNVLMPDFIVAAIRRQQVEVER